MDIEAILRHAGLSRKQAIVYGATLRLGEASMTDLARGANLKRPTAYLVVEELLTNGIISETTRGKRKIYSAIHPRRLLEMARFREQQIEDSLPQLVALFHSSSTKPKVQAFEGVAGVRSLYRDVFHSLNNKQETLWFARIGAIRRHMPEVLNQFKKLLRELPNPKIRELNYGDAEGKQWVKETERLRGKKHFVRTLPTDYEFGFSDNLIFDNKLVIFSLKEEVSVIIIESEEITKTYRALFEWAWRQGVRQ